MNRKDHLGKYYQKNGRFQTKRDKNSIGLCIISDYEKDVIMSFEEEQIDHKDIDKENLPSYLEMITAFSKFKTDLDLSFYKSYWIYLDFIMTSRAYYYASADGGIGCLSIDDFPDNRYNGRGSRCFRKVWRVKK